MADSRLEPLVLSKDERRTLENWVKRRSIAQGLALRARIVLACAQGGSNLAVAARVGVDRKTVRKWRTRFLRERLDEAPLRPAAPRLRDLPAGADVGGCRYRRKVHRLVQAGRVRRDEVTAHELRAEGRAARRIVLAPLGRRGQDLPLDRDRLTGDHGTELPRGLRAAAAR